MLPFYELSKDDRSAPLLIVSVVFSLFTVSSVVAKHVIRQGAKSIHSFGLIILVSTLFSLSQTCCTVYAIHSGLGKHRFEIDVSALKMIRKVYKYLAICLSLVPESTDKDGVSICRVSLGNSHNSMLEICDVPPHDGDK